MGRNTTIALAAGVVVLGGAGAYLFWRRRQAANPTQAMLGGSVPLYVPGGPDPFNPQGPPLPSSNKLGAVQQQVTSAVQQAGDAASNAVKAFETGKKAWDDVKGFFS